MPRAESEWGLACTHAGGRADVHAFATFGERANFVDTVRGIGPASPSTLLDPEAFHLDTRRVVPGADARCTVFPPEAGQFDAQWDATGSAFMLRRPR